MHTALLRDRRTKQPKKLSHRTVPPLHILDIGVPPEGPGAVMKSRGAGCVQGQTLQADSRYLHIPFPEHA